MASSVTNQKQKPDIISYKKRNALDLAKNDGKYQEMIKMQEFAQAAWEEKWGFMKHEEIEKIYREEAIKRNLDEDFIEKRRLKYHRKTSEFPSLSLKPSGPVPMLSSGFAGWRSSDPECSLEIVGPLYVSPRLSIDPPPLENDIDLKNQKFIILG
ncbi:uncharacterized protein LOC142326519 [Lycorma delicatula]|uniref:uncharacterized protein LOC142326519 n=1 Tax=Lycorma delicatula TaxID=130591 RepID=UPI003F511597